ISQDFVSRPVVDPDRVHDVLAVRLKADVKGLPPSGKLDLPCELALALCDVGLAPVAATFYVCLSYSAARADVYNLFFIRQVLLCNRGVESAAVVAHRKIWQHFRELVLPHKLGYLLPKFATIFQYSINRP